MCLKSLIHRSKQNKDMKMALAREYEQNIRDRKNKEREDKLNLTKIEKEHLDIGTKLGINDSINEINRKQVQKYYLNNSNVTFIHNYRLN